MDATEIAYAGAARQAQLIRDGEVTSREVVEATLRRIEALNPVLNAYVSVLAERALAEADQADARRRGGDDRPLLGVPVAIKDDVDVSGEPTAWGTAAHAGPKDRDAEVVRRLRGAGAVITGKTLVPEMTMLPATDTTTFGAARNPWNLSRTPGGSSGGTAAAVASGLCGVGLGSDGAGSIRGPSAWCGLFGLKPTRDRVPLDPHTDAWQGMSVNGPIARTVADAALFLDATVDGAGGAFTAALAAPPRGLRVALSVKGPPGVLFRLGTEERRNLEAVADALRELGHEVVERDVDWPPDTWITSYIRVLRGIHDDVKSSMPHAERLEARTRRIAALGGAIPAKTLSWAREREREQAARILRLWDDVDVLLCPSTVDGPYRAGEIGRWNAATYFLRAGERLPFFAGFNMTGQPGANVPSGLDADGLPTGAQLVGRPGDDERLVALAAQLEERAGWAERRPSLAS